MGHGSGSLENMKMKKNTKELVQIMELVKKRKQRTCQAVEAAGPTTTSKHEGGLPRTGRSPMGWKWPVLEEKGQRQGCGSEPRQGAAESALQS